MKKCPFCNADIEDNARFCLYCMSSLDEKKKIKPKSNKNNIRYIIIAAVSVLLAAVIVAVIVVKSLNPDSVPTYSSSIVRDASSSYSSEFNETSYSESDSGSYNDNSAVTSVAQKSNQSTKTNSTEDNKSSVSEIISSITSQSTTSVTSKSGTTSSRPEGTYYAIAEYSFRPAVKGDDYDPNADLTNCVVVDKVTRSARNGTYAIPETYQGKKVIGVSAYAFADLEDVDTVKDILLPDGVVNLPANSLAGCVNLKQLLFLGHDVYLDYNALPPVSKRNYTVTLGCPSTCKNRNGQYFSNLESYYGVSYITFGD